jgi:hypothetical protein
MNIWTMLTGDKYGPEHVQRLMEQVWVEMGRRDVGYHFRVLTDEPRNIPGAHDVLLPEPLPGWWGKLALFSPQLDQYTTHGANVWLDLDVAIVGDLTELLPYGQGGALSCAANWAASGHGGCQSSVMVWGPAAVPKLHVIWDEYDRRKCPWPPVHRPPEQLWGDQEVITDFRDRGRIEVQHFDERLVRSYKYHVRGRNAVPEGAIVLAFHGEPKPWDVGW